MKSVQQRWAAHVYEIRPRADKHRVDLISDALPYRPIWYRGPKQSEMQSTLQSFAVDHIAL